MLNGDTESEWWKGQSENKINVYDIHIHEIWGLWNVEPDSGLPNNKGAIGDDSCGQSEFPKGHVDLRKIIKRALKKLLSGYAIYILQPNKILCFCMS